MRLSLLGAALAALAGLAAAAAAAGNIDDSVISGRAACGACGAVGGECVHAFSVAGCGAQQVEEFSPKACDGTCIAPAGGFESLHLCGNGFTAVNCEVYSDSACKNYIGETQDQLHSSACFPFHGAKSMICWWDC